MQQKEQKKTLIMEYNSAALKSSSPPPMSQSPSKKKSNNWSVSNHIYLNPRWKLNKSSRLPKIKWFPIRPGPGPFKNYSRKSPINPGLLSSESCTLKMAVSDQLMGLRYFPISKFSISNATHFRKSARSPFSAVWSNSIFPRTKSHP